MGVGRVLFDCPRGWAVDELGWGLELWLGLGCVHTYIYMCVCRSSSMRMSFGSLDRSVGANVRVGIWVSVCAFIYTFVTKQVAFTCVFLHSLYIVH